MTEIESCCFTGHRVIPAGEAREVERNLRFEVTRMIEERGIRRFYYGGALGFDLLAAETVLGLADAYSGIELILVCPCEDQTKGWRDEDVERYFYLRGKCKEVVTLRPTYAAGCMQERNRYLVDHSRYCIAFLEGTVGGTAYTVGYAKKQGVPVVNVSPRVYSEL